MRDSVRDMIQNSPALLSGTKVYSDNFALTISGVLGIYYDLTVDDCQLILDSKILKTIQFARDKVSESTLELINIMLLPSNRDINLSVTLNGHGAFTDLHFLRNICNLKNLSVDFFESNEVNKINQYLQLDQLAISSYGISIKEIVHQTSLKKLWIGEQPKDIQIAGQMNWLENLTLCGQSLKSLDFLKPLTNLTELHFLSGGTRNFSALPEIGKIQKLSFTRVRLLTVSDLMPINNMKFIKHISFTQQAHLTDLNWLSNKNIVTEITDCKNYQC